MPQKCLENFKQRVKVKFSKHSLLYSTAGTVKREFSSYCLSCKSWRWKSAVNLFSTLSVAAGTRPWFSDDKLPLKVVEMCLWQQVLSYKKYWVLKLRFIVHMWRPSRPRRHFEFLLQVMLKQIPLSVAQYQAAQPFTAVNQYAHAWNKLFKTDYSKNTNLL